MRLLSLGYVGIGSSDLEDWTGFATGLLGMQIADRTATSIAFRMDDRRQRVVVDREMADGVRYFGWEVADADALAAVAARVEQSGRRVERGAAALAAQRFVEDLVFFDDPAGNRVEVFHGAQTAREPFSPGRAISGFRTGPLGLGHVVITTPDVEAAVTFYRKVLGFGLSDYMLAPFKGYFLHTNPRHHSLAVIQSEQASLHHLMVELFQLDDIGQGYDIAQEQEGRVAVTLGRHSNDYMTSFYVRSPSRFMVEYGWGGRSVDPESWQPRELTEGPSLWGHERNWLGPEQRRHARDMRMRAAAQGLRAPVQVLEGNHLVMPGTCALWDELTRQG